MTQYLEYIKMALMNIRCNKGRSILTMLGIIIGISSVIMVISIGNGVSSEVTDQLNSLAGGQLAFYTPGYMGDASTEEDVEVEFKEEDFQFIEENIPHVKGASPNYQFNATAISQKGQFEGYMYAGRPAIQYLYQEPIVKGRYFNEADYQAGARVCIIRESSAIAMFGTTDAIGNTFETDIYGMTAEWTVIGIRKDNASKSALSGLFMYFDEVEMELPLTALSYFGYDLESFNLFYVFTDGPQYASDCAKEIMSALKKRFHVPATSDAIRMQDFNDQMGQITQIVGYITVFVVFVAAISLLVGGIGVMNIMLVSVTERTREIGIRKSLGARTGSIMTQFLFEAAIITLIGGVIGIILGVAGAKLVCGLMGFKASLSAFTIIFTTLFSSGIGMFFGIYPAKKAAKLSPIEALRHE